MLNRIVSITLGMAALLWAPLAPAQALPAGMTRVQSVEGITEYRMSNGLQVLLIPDESKPTTTVNMTYRVGSRHENYGETGMAHLLEHLLFKGSKKHPAPWSEFTKRGLAANGTTWFDRTNYFASFSANDDNLRWYIGWQADAMVNSFIARKDLDSEMTVVRNEMERGENSPQRMLFEKTLATMYQWHNYGKSTIGARSDVENVSIPSLQAFYRKYYQPDNATLIVAGKFEPARVLRWVAESFGGIKKPTRQLPEQYTLDPAQDGERSVTLRRVGGVPQIFAGYHVPPAAHVDYVAVEALNVILGDTPSGRLHRQLVEQQLAAATFAFSQGLEQPGFAIYGAQLAPGQDVDKARDAMLRVIESLPSQPVTAEELKRAQVKWLKDWDQAFTDPEKIGVALSESVAQGDWRLFFLTRDRMRDLQLGDVQRVAEQRLLKSNRTLGTYLPTDKPERAPVPAPIDVQAQMQGFKPQAAAAVTEAFDTRPAALDQRTQRLKIGGIDVALLPKATRGNAVRAVLTLRFGNVQTLTGHNEVPALVAEMLDRGTRRMTRQQIQDRLDELRTEMSIQSGDGQVVVSLVSRREHLPAAIALVGDVLREPSFPPEALDELRRQKLAAIEEQRKEPEAVVANALARRGNPYPRGDVRYVPTFDELVQDVQAAKLEDIRAFHKRFYAADHAQFAAVGDHDPAAVKAALDQALGGWTGTEPYARVPRPLVPVEPGRLMLPTPDKQNATMLVRYPVPLSDTHADYPALMMANYLLGLGGNSRLWTRIRETDGLSYDVRSTISWNSHEPHSEWHASAIFAPQNQPKVEAAFLQELERARKSGFTAAELEEGKRGLLAFRRLSRAQDANLARTLVGDLYLGRTFRFAQKTDEALNDLTLDQVNAAIRTYLVPEKFVSGFAGDFKR